MSAIDPNCRAIAAKAANGKLTQQEILDAFDRIDQRKRAMEAAGQTTGKAERLRKWAAEEGERTKIAAAMTRRHAALNVLVRTRLDRQISNMIDFGLKPHQALRAVLEGINSAAPGSRDSVDNAKLGAKRRYVGGLMADIARDKPHLEKMLGDPKLDVDVLTEMWELRKDGKPGSTKNADAIYLAKKFADYAELSRSELNRLGASIGKLDGWAGVQMHDPIKMIAVGKDAWVGRIVTLLDHERTFPEGVTATEAADVLRDIYDTIVTGIPAAPSAIERGARVNPANLAKSLGKSRVLHFQDAQATLAYRAQFGYGNTISGMFAHLGHMGDLAGTMDRLGPNPEVMFRAIAAKMQRDIRGSKTIPDAQKQKLIDKLSTDAGALKHAIDVTTGLVSRPVNVNAAKISSDVRAVESMAKLGAALPSSFSDTVTAALAAQFRGSRFLPSLMRQLGGMMKGRPRHEQAEIAYMLGEGFEGMLGHILNLAHAEDGPVGVAGRMLPAFFKWNGLTWWTDVGRATAARTIGAELGMHAGTAYAELTPRFRNVLSQAGIDAQTWAVLGKAALRLDNGKPYMTPDRVREIPAIELAPLVQDRIDAINASKLGADAKAERIGGVLEDARRGLETKLLAYVADQTNYAVVVPDARTKRYLTQGTRPGTLGGEALRFIMQFKSFPLAFTTRVFGRALYAHAKDATFLDRSAHVGSLIAGLTVAGYMAMVAKDMLKGYWPPRNPADPRTILAALQQGGAIGIYGDYLFSQTNRFGGGLVDTALGPSVGTAGNLWDVYNDARDAATSGGQDAFSGARAFSTALQNIPYANLHLLKPALDFLIVNSIREALSPGYMRRQEKTRAKEYGQASLVPQVTGRPAMDPLNIAPGF